MRHISQNPRNPIMYLISKVTHTSLIIKTHGNLGSSCIYELHIIDWGQTKAQKIELWNERSNIGVLAYSTVPISQVTIRVMTYKVGSDVSFTSKSLNRLENSSCFKRKEKGKKIKIRSRKGRWRWEMWNVVKWF